MIGWKCELGYSIPYEINGNTNWNFPLGMELPKSALHKTDEGYITFPVSTRFSAGSFSFDTATQCYDFLKSIIGDDVNLLCGAKYSAVFDPNNPEINFQNLMSTIPSIKNWFPVWNGTKYDLIPTPVGDERPQYYIKIFSLGKLYFPFESGIGRGFNIENNIIKYVGGNLSFGSNRYNISTFYTFVYFGGDISKIENYGMIGVSTTRSPKIAFKVDLFDSFSDSAIGGFNFIFSNATEPDISGGELPPDNPYGPGGDSGEGGGGGSFDDDSDPIPDSSLPTISSANTGFTRIYNPTLSQVQDFARYLWTDESIIETIWNHIKQFFENPMDAIIGFNLVPCAVPNGGTENVKILFIDTGVPMIVAANQFVDVDCGTLELKEYYGSALDYAPYTKIACFLPFIGNVELNVDEVMGKTLQVKYRIDICSGSCVAKVFVAGSVLYQFSGHCAITIPISAADFTSYVNAAITAAKMVGGAILGGPAGLLAGMEGSGPSQQTNQSVTTTTSKTARNPETGRQITMSTKTVTKETDTEITSTKASFSGLTPSSITNTVGEIMGSKPHIEHAGSFTGNSGYLGVRRPYLIIQRPNMCMPSQYQQFNGFPSMITETLSSLKGFTRIQQVQLTGMSATNPEQSEILEFLKSGVII